MWFYFLNFFLKLKFYIYKNILAMARINRKVNDKQVHTFHFIGGHLKKKDMIKVKMKCLFLYYNVSFGFYNHNLSQMLILSSK